MKYCLLLLCIVSLFLLNFGCVRGLPTLPVGREVGEEKVRGIRVENGDSIISKELFYQSYLPVDPTGGHFPGAYWTKFYLRSGGSDKSLGFLKNEEENNGKYYQFMNEILPVEGTDRWVVFRMVRCAREFIDVNCIVFDARGIHREFIVKHAVRKSLSGANWEKISNYSIQQSEDSTGIVIDTLDGVLTYDGVSDIVKLNQHNKTIQEILNP